MDRVLDGRTALVVGASSGIGRSIALRLTGLGASVVLAARRTEKLETLAAEIGAAGVVTADVRIPEDCERIIVEATFAAGALDLVVYATGTSPLKPLADLDGPDWSTTLATNVIGASLVTRAAIPVLSPNAIVAYLSSETVGRPRHSLVAYAASKAALEEVVRGYRVEHPEVRFACLALGQTIGTDFGNGFSSDSLGAAWPSWIANGEMRARYMDADDLGGCIAEVLAVTLAHPEIDLERFALRPTGPTLGLD